MGEAQGAFVMLNCNQQHSASHFARANTNSCILQSLSIRTSTYKLISLHGKCGTNIAFKCLFPQTTEVTLHMKHKALKEKLISQNGIWILLDSRKPGGIESHVLQLAVGLHKHDQDVLVIFLNDYGDHPLRDALLHRGISTTTLNGSITTLWNIVQKSRPSILHTHGYKSGILGRFVAALCNIPVASTYHAGETSSGKLKLYDWLDRQTARLASRVFAVSPQIARRLPVNATVVDNFVESNGLQISYGKQIAFVGRLSIEKGPDYFLRTARRFPQYHFHIYGDGPLAAELKLSAPINLHFHGQQDDMASVWPKIGLLVMPSRHEGLPMAALEAMVRGIPVLASRVGALNQLVDTDSNGWLVTPGDGDELANRLRLWVGMSKQQRHSFKRAAREKILQRFSADIAIPQLISIYWQIAS